MGEFFLTLILLLLIAYCMLLLFIAFVDPLWHKVLRGVKPDIKLSYENFMKYYNLAPHRYKLGERLTHLVRYDDYSFDGIWIGFNIIDTYKVVHTLKAAKKRQNIIEQREQENERMKKYLIHVQKDIDILLKESDKQINEVKETVNTAVSPSPYAQASPCSQVYIGNTSSTYDWKIENGRLVKFVK